MKKKLMVLLGSSLAFAPFAALAATTVNIATCAGSGTVTVTNLEQLLCKVSLLLNSVVPVLIALGVVYFVWGVIQYVIASDEEAKKKGRNSIIWGLIGLAVIIALWGLVRILSNTFVGDAGNNQSITLPGYTY